MYILGISAYFHDSAAALIKDGVLLAAAQEERFTRIKNDSAFPINAVRFLLEDEYINASHIEKIIFYDKPWLKFERILESSIAFAPYSLKNFLMSMPIWLSTKLNARKQITNNLIDVDPKFKDTKLLFSEHHFSHAASSFYTSPFTDACSITIDGVGEWATTSIIDFKSDGYNYISEIHYPHSIGLLYSAFTCFCGFRVNSGEYKLMGLAPYGIKDDKETVVFINQIKDNLLTIFEDGSIQLNLEYFSFYKNGNTINEAKFQKLFSLKSRREEEEISQSYANFALAAQVVTEEIIIKIIQHASSVSKSKNLCLSGGVALNCVANSKIQSLNLFENIWIHPSPGDAGGAVGAALAVYYSNHKYLSCLNFTPYLGPSYSDKNILAELNTYGLPFKKYTDTDLFHFCGKKLSQSNIVGWFQGKLEWGPRSLGNRSILANPCDQEMQLKLNLKIKFREGFRPFAPVVIEEDAHKYFQKCTFSPYMQYTYQVMDASSKSSTNTGFKNRLKSIKSKTPAITHLDLSARVQTVNASQNDRLYKLIKAFETHTQIPMLINTSFNVRGEPIVCSPKDAIECFLSTNMDILVLGNFIIERCEIPTEKLISKRDFLLD